MTIKITHSLVSLSFFSPLPLKVFLHKYDPEYQNEELSHLNGSRTIPFVTSQTYNSLFKRVIKETALENTKERFKNIYSKWKILTHIIRTPLLSVETLDFALNQAKITLSTLAELNLFASHLHKAEKAVEENQFNQALNHILNIESPLFLVEALTQVAHLIFKTKGHIPLLHFFENIPSRVRVSILTALIEKAPKNKIKDYVDLILLTTLTFLRFDETNSSLLSDLSQLIFEHSPIKAIVVAFFIHEEQQKILTLQEYLDELFFVEGEENDSDFSTRICSTIRLIKESLTYTQVISESSMNTMLSKVLSNIAENVNDPLIKLLLIATIPESQNKEEAIHKATASLHFRKNLADQLLVKELQARVELLDSETARFCSQSLFCK